MLKDDDKTLQIWPPKLVPKNLLNEIASLRQKLPQRHYVRFFLADFFRAFGALWVLLGRLLGFLEALLGGLWTQKRVKTTCFLMVLKRQFFGL